MYFILLYLSINFLINDGVKIANENQGVLAVITIALALIGFFSWKWIHIRERRSNFYFEILKKIYDLQFLILEQRQPKFKQRDDKLIQQIDMGIERINEIKNKSYIILKELVTIEKIMNIKNHPNSISNLYKEKISEQIVSEISKAAVLFNMSRIQEDILKFLFPTEYVESGLSDDVYNQIEIGLYVIKDDLNNKIELNFNIITAQIQKQILV